MTLLLVTLILVYLLESRIVDDNQPPKDRCTKYSNNYTEHCKKKPHSYCDWCGAPINIGICFDPKVYAPCNCGSINSDLTLCLVTSTCCWNGKSFSTPTCCPESTHCCIDFGNAGSCCAKDTTCCGASCCLSNQTCCNNGNNENSCCDKGQRCHQSEGRCY